MKPVLTLLLVCTALTLRAQIITYDYKSSRYVPAENCCVSKCATIRYRISNINPFAEKAIINGTMIALTSDMPEQLKTLFNIKADEVKDKLNETKEQVNEMVNVNEDVKDATKKAAATADSNLAKEQTETEKLVAYCNEYYQKADSINIALRIEEQLLETMTDATNYNDTLMRKALMNRGIEPSVVAKLRSDYANFVNAYNKVYNQYEKAAKAAERAKDEGNRAKIETAERQVEKDHEDLKKLYKKTIDKVESLFATATNPAYYEFVSAPVGVNDGVDAIEFAIKTGKFDADDANLSVHNKTLWVRGGWKVDFSVGPVINFIRDDQYFFGSKSSTDTTKVLKSRSEGTYFAAVTPTVASMIHLYKRQCKGTAFGGTFGVNVAVKDLTDINLGFLAGVSAIFGRAQKVVVSSGVSYLSVSRLKAGQYAVDAAYPATKIEDVTERVLRPSWFLAVSLSISKRTVIKPTP